MQYDILHYRHCCRTTMIKGKESWNYRVTQSSRCWVKLLYILFTYLQEPKKSQTQREISSSFLFFFLPWHGKLKRRFSPIFNVPSIFALSSPCSRASEKELYNRTQQFCFTWMFECLLHAKSIGTKVKRRRWKRCRHEKNFQNNHKRRRRRRRPFFILKRFLCCLLAIQRGREKKDRREKLEDKQLKHKVINEPSRAQHIHDNCKRKLLQNVESS